jgi:hypothetical protein
MPGNLVVQNASPELVVHVAICCHELDVARIFFCNDMRYAVSTVTINHVFFYFG